MLRKRDNFARWRRCGAWFAMLALCACGGGGGGGRGGTPDPDGDPVVCKTGDAAPVPGQCGQLFVGFSDIEGDFLRYRVDIVSLRLLRTDGARMELLPTRDTVDLTEYLDLSELLTAATLPLGSYVGAEITIDYKNADIRVDLDGVAVSARLVDARGHRVESVTVELVFDPLRRLRIRSSRPALLQLDFNLAASHIVDTQVLPPLVELLPVVTAHVDPLLPQVFRLRGPLIGAGERETAYRMAVRPFYRVAGRRGGVDIHANFATEWNIDGETFSGIGGLGALEALPAGSLTLAFGSYDGDRQRFTAEQVFAGSSVPGVSRDALKGQVLARDFNTAILLGARLIRTDGSVEFRDAVPLQFDINTLVTRPGSRLRRSRAEISVGQRITALGLWDEELELLRADGGQVRLQPTALAAFMNSISGAEMAVAALEFNRRDSALFDFTGTGTTPDEDAVAANYRVDFGSLEIPRLTVSTPLMIHGFAAPIGTAPPDFEAFAIEDFVGGGAQMLVTWAGEGSANAFLELSASGLRPNLNSAPLGREHHIRRGAVLTDLLVPTPAPRLLPVLEGGLYTLAQDGLVTMHSDFAEFAVELDRRMDFGGRVKILHAEGGYRNGANTMPVTAVQVVLTE